MDQTEFFERFFEGTLSTHKVDDPLVISAEEASQIEAKHQIFTTLTSYLSLQQALEASNKERDQWGIMHDITLTYGEADFVSLGEIFLTAKNRYATQFQGGVFYDLGSVIET
mmetsp:Transcript_13019/g.24193  ORF Transcript_13019/g.24193 Transcript_13019/m.24193 type:complete len:112 (+) Transcript_13019:1248-1583(+)